jgi:AcrR family transcriptional regulator
MGISERRAREREQRRGTILASAWHVAQAAGWAAFSVEQVAAHAELGRATIYGYFESLEALILEMARQACDELSERVAQAAGLPEALDVPVRFNQQRPAAFGLLFPPNADPRPHLQNERLESVRAEARTLIGRLQRLAERSSGGLPADARSAAAFVAGISMAGAVVPELASSTTLRHRWQDFCLRNNEAENDSKTS